ncbi:AzlD domain-containing protein [Virgibacillus siamensis]|uniref:AzlD domain-containing protein n=1 Tax=Virgibacillus siamensis TaxID=480071 RepID=A0ABP3R5R6_9BACI
MSISLPIFLIIVGCTIVTFIPRIIPFTVVRNMKLNVVTKWLSFIPICIFTALIISSFIIEDGSLLTINWSIIFVIIPTLIIALWTKSLSVTVIVGI